MSAPKVKAKEIMVVLLFPFDFPFNSPHSDKLRQLIKLGANWASLRRATVLKGFRIFFVASLGNLAIATVGLLAGWPAIDIAGLSFLAEGTVLILLAGVVDLGASMSFREFSRKVLKMESLQTKEDARRNREIASSILVAGSMLLIVSVLLVTPYL